ncbi:MAG: YdeI/OmpD-associated family protein [Acidobacteriota bacterium]
MPEITETFFAESREAWRHWLEHHGTLKSEIWLILNKRHVSAPSVTLDQAVEEALCFGWIDGILKRIDDRQHAVRFTPRQKDSRWSARNRARVERLIEAGKMTESGLALVEHAKQSGEWDALSGSLRDQPLPDELRLALERDDASRHWFDKLAPSHRRQFLAWIHEAKRDETRQRRIAKVLEMIRSRTKPGI